MNATLTAPAKFDRRAIALAAWSLVKTAGKTLSEGMKAAWGAAKQTFKTVMSTFQDAIAAEDSDLANERNHYRLGYAPSESRPGEWISIDRRTMFRLLKAQQEGTLAKQYRLAAEALDMMFRGNVDKWKASMKSRLVPIAPFISHAEAEARLAALNAAGNFRHFDNSILEA